MSQISRMLAGVAVAAGIAALADASHAAAPAPPAVKPNAVLQKEFDGFIARFRVALQANDAAAVTAMTRLPFFHDHAMIDAVQFRAKAYPAYFNASTRTCLKRGRAVYDRDGENNDNYFIFCGQRIFVFTRTPAGFLFSGVDVND